MNAGEFNVRTVPEPSRRPFSGVPAKRLIHVTPLLLALLVAIAKADLAETQPSPTTQPTTLPAAATQPVDRPTVIVVLGAGGTAEYGQDFSKAADRIADAAKRGSAHLITIGRADPTPDGATDKQWLQATLNLAMQQTAQPLWLIFIGHGTFDGKEAKFNLRGPDVSDLELAAWLHGCRRPLAVIDCASASAPFLNRLAGRGRVVITSTQSGREVNITRFGQYFAEAIADPAADLDKDGQTSLLEAFLAASHRVEEFYKQEGRLMTEHALLDDNGDGMGTPASWFSGLRATRSAKAGAPVDGTRANQWHLVLNATEQAMPQELRARRDELELKLESLRGQKTKLSETAYFAQLEDLMVQLAHIYEQPPGNATGDVK
jgi:hypothetical protein